MSPFSILFMPFLMETDDFRACHSEFLHAAIDVISQTDPSVSRKDSSNSFAD